MIGNGRDEVTASTRSVSFRDNVDQNSNASNQSSSSHGEAAPLLRKSSSAADSVDGVLSSTRSVDSSSAGGYFGFSSHWLNTANLDAKEVFRSERERAVEKGVVQAAFLIRDAVLGESENPSKGTYDPYLHPENSIRNLLSLVFRQILSNRYLRKLSFVAVWSLALLTCVEPPSWCRDGYNGDESLNCQVVMALRGPAASAETNETTTNLTGAAFPGEDDVEYYPSSHFILLSKEQSIMIEWICLSVFSLVLLFRIGRDGCSLFRFLRRGPARTIRSLQLCAIAMLLVGLRFEYSLFQPFARLLLLGTNLKIIYQEVQTTLEIVSARTNYALALLCNRSNCYIEYTLPLLSFSYHK